MQSSKKKILKIVGLILLIIVVGAGWWAADFFLIPKAQQKGVIAPVDLHPTQEVAVGDGTTASDGEETSKIESAVPTDTANTLTTEDGDKYPLLLDEFPADAVDLPVEAGTGSEDDPEGTTVLGAVDGLYKIVVTKTVTGQGDEKLTYFVADVLVSDVRELKSCFAQDTYGENIYEKTDSMAERCNAILAVNGDYYGWRSDGVEIRNGELFRNEPTRLGLGIFEDGYMRCFDETQVSAQELLDQKVWNTFSFGPELVHDGQVTDHLDEDYSVDLTGIQHKAPRTVIGQVGKNHFVFVVVDGRQAGYSKGIRLTDLAELMQQLGCKEAYNLDGGASSTMYFKGQIINHPSSSNGERYVSDCIFMN